MSEKESIRREIDVFNYVTGDKGIDPIGGGDIIRDFMNYSFMAEIEGWYESPEQLWKKYGEERFEEQFGIKFPG